MNTAICLFVGNCLLYILMRVEDDLHKRVAGDLYRVINGYLAIATSLIFISVFALIPVLTMQRGLPDIQTFVSITLLKYFLAVAFGLAGFGIYMRRKSFRMRRSQAEG